MSGADGGDLLAGVPESLRSLLPELCVELRESLAAAWAASGGGSPGPGAAPPWGGAAAPDDASETARMAHAFKSAAVFYGLPGLAGAAGLAEDAARSGRLGEARKALSRCAELLGEFEAACACMDKT